MKMQYGNFTYRISVYNQIKTTGNRAVCTVPEGTITGFAHKMGAESLTLHYNLRQPLTCGCLVFSLLFLVIRNQIDVFLDAEYLY